MTPCLLYPAVLTDLDLLQDMETAASADPDTLTGTPCCPGVVEGVVRVVNTINETQVIMVSIMHACVSVCSNNHDDVAGNDGETKCFVYSS